MTGPAGGGSGTPLTPYRGFATTLVDRIEIAVSGNGVTYLDNIVLGMAAVDAVPEPATWAMMIGGFGLVGAVMRRRRAVAVAWRRGPGCDPDRQRAVALNLFEGPPISLSAALVVGWVLKQVQHD